MAWDGGGGGAGIARVGHTDRMPPLCCPHASFRDRFGLQMCSLLVCTRVLSCEMSQFWCPITPCVASLRPPYRLVLSYLCISKQYPSKSRVSSESCASSSAT